MDSDTKSLLAIAISVLSVALNLIILPWLDRRKDRAEKATSRDSRTGTVMLKPETLRRQRWNR